MPPFHDQNDQNENDNNAGQQDNFLGQWLVLGAPPN